MDGKTIGHKLRALRGEMDADEPLSPHTGRTGATPPWS